MKKNKMYLGCRDIAKQLNLHPNAVSIRGRTERWPGAFGTRWKVPLDFVEGLKLGLLDGDKWLTDLRYAQTIINQVLWSDGFMDDSNNFERLRLVLSNLDIVIDNLCNPTGNDFDLERIKSLAEGLKSSKSVKEQAKATIAITDYLKINNPIIEKMRNECDNF